MIPSEPFIRDSMLAIRTNGIAYMFYPEQMKIIKKMCINEKIEIIINDGNSFAKAIYKKLKES